MADRLSELGMRPNLDHAMETLRDRCGDNSSRQAIDQIQLALELLNGLPKPNLTIQREVIATLELSEAEVFQASNQMDILSRLRLLKHLAKAIRGDEENREKTRQLTGAEAWMDLVKEVGYLGDTLAKTRPVPLG